MMPVLFSPLFLFSKLASVLTTIWVAGLWQGALFVLLGTITLRLMRGASAAFRHSVLIALFGLTIVLPWLSFHASGHPVKSATHVMRLSPWIAYGIATCWAVAVCFRVVTFAIAWRHLREVRRSAVQLPFDLRKLDINVSRLPMVCTSTAVDSPFILGFFRPVLLLPEWLLPTLSAEDFRQIALHELEHLRRGDDWTNLLLQIGLTLFPLNPALLWFNRKIGVQRELACDAAVVATTTRPVDYASSLARIAEHRLKRNTLRFALAAWGRQSELSQRIHALLGQPAEWTRLQRTAGAGTVAGVLLACVAGFLHAPQFIQVERASSAAIASTSVPSLPLPERIAPALSSRASTPSLQFVQASYTARQGEHVQSLQNPGAHEVAHVHRHRAPQLVSEFTTVQSVELSSARTETVAATGTTESSIEMLPPHAPARAVPVLFLPTYLAVPVSHGWILIQL